MNGRWIVQYSKVLVLAWIVFQATSTVNGQQLKTDSLVHKSIGINLWFPVVALTYYTVPGNEDWRPGAPYFALSYRQGSDFFRWRADLSFIPSYYQNNIQSFNNLNSKKLDSLYLPDGPVVYPPDSFEFRLRRNGHSENFSLRLGLEWLAPLQKVNVYYGLDLVLGCTHFYRENTIIAEPLDRERWFENYYIAHYEERVYLFNVQFGAFAGTEVFLSKRFSLDAKLGVEYLSYHNNRMAEWMPTYELSGTRISNTYNNFGLFSDISLFFKL